MSIYYAIDTSIIGQGIWDKTDDRLEYMGLYDGHYCGPAPHHIRLSMALSQLQEVLLLKSAIEDCEKLLLECGVYEIPWEGYGGQGLGITKKSRNKRRLLKLKEECEEMLDEIIRTIPVDRLNFANLLTPENKDVISQPKPCDIWK